MGVNQNNLKVVLEDLLIVHEDEVDFACSDRIPSEFPMNSFHIDGLGEISVPVSEEVQFRPVFIINKLQFFTKICIRI